MTERNKLSLSLYAKLGILLIWAAVTVIACAGNWNHNPEAFVNLCTVILFVMNLGVIAYLFVKWKKEYDAALKAIQDKERQDKIDQANKGK